MGRNDDAWAELNDRYNIVDAVDRFGFFRISANQIKQYREPRLMTKFDHASSLPELFRNEGLSILPITRGDYVIGRMRVYERFGRDDAETVRVTLPDYLQTLTEQMITSEAIALNAAEASGVLADFLEDDAIAATVSGRMGSGVFDFSIRAGAGELGISVNQSQIEIDAAYEGRSYLSLFEAKRNLSDDFLVRQLYYPLRTWAQRVTKPVKTVFLVYTGGTFYLREYAWGDIGRYNDFRLIKQRNYQIADGVTIADVESIIRNVRVVREPEIPFPQADKFERIINLLEMMQEHPISGVEITDANLFTPRQTNYYTTAGRYLGLIEPCRIDGSAGFGLTEEGFRVMHLTAASRKRAIISAILCHGVFRSVAIKYLQAGGPVPIQVIEQDMRAADLYHMEAPSMYRRRASTVAGWVDWIFRSVDG